ncbi:MAG TPA: type II secretion system protein [Dehalococcoidia bacterium]|nr:type II secretion system protein [Dehalococcoidia bacterium]
MKQARGGVAYRQRGFTLLEALLVIATLAIIALIVVANFGWFSGRGQTEVCEMEERLVKTATLAYALINEACPTSIEDLAPYIDDPEDIMGSYSFGGTYPDCTVTQDSCP